MDHREFIKMVAARAGLSREEAADLSRATLEALADRLSGGEVRDLAARLPGPLAEALESAPHARDRAKRCTLEEVVHRVGEHTGLTEQETTAGIRAVLSTLRDEIGATQYTQVMAQLPREFRDLVTAGPG